MAHRVFPIAEAYEPKRRLPDDTGRVERRCIDLGSYFSNVFTAVSATGEWHDYIVRFKPPQPNAGAQNVHLPAGIIDIVLAMHRKTCSLKKVADRCAIGCVPTVSDMQWTGWVSRYEFQQKSRAIPLCLVTVCAARFQNCVQLGMEGGWTQVKIDESWASDLHFRNLIVIAQGVDKISSNFARILAGRFCQTHRNVAGEIAVAGISGALHRRADIEISDRIRERGLHFECIIY